MSDLRERAPAHSLIEQLLHQWDVGAIRHGLHPGEIVIDDEARSWYQGVIGERRIAQLLRQLGPEWTVLHSVPFGTGSTDIDHVVIGPGGVFTINTKYSPGKDVWSAGVGMYVGGHKQRYVRRSLDESRAASDRLSQQVGRKVPVFGVVVFVEPGNINRKDVAGVEGEVVYVLADDELLQTLRSGEMFTTTEIDLIVTAAIRPDTWHRAPKPSTLGDQIAREFDALEVAVGPAIRAARLVIGSNGSPPRVPLKPSTKIAYPRPGSRPVSSRLTSSPSRQRPGESRKHRPRKTAFEKLIKGLIGPALLFTIGLIWLNAMAHH